MLYLPPFEMLKKQVKVKSVAGQAQVSTSYDDFLSIIKLLLRGVPVEEKWYCETYPDVAEAIAAGTYRSAKHHFIEDGYFEGRLPFALTVDEDWYVKKYDDVLEGIELGEIASARDHFRDHGYHEGRFPIEY